MRYLILFLLTYSSLQSQSLDLSYYLPDVEYDTSIPTPKEFIGHEVGEWHVTHDKQYYYMKELARVSDRITLTEYAKTYEGRPLIYLTVTSEKNRVNLEEIRIEHKKLTDPAVSDEVNIDNLPVVIYQGNSIHGNEPSGGNGALATAYYLAAAQGPEIDKLLDQAIILFDPCYNPDGFQRFSTWVNTHKGKHMITDPNSREYNENWPRGRTNHYWFDLNRDWLLLTHPESRGRIKTFHHWKPDILTDHHEMGSNSTFFYQPGIPTRTNPNTPKRNQELTALIGEYHAEALDDIGSLYYTKESYDDFYYGKGSTYPDAQGCIGILFEQASSRGHLQQTDHGLLSFPFTIRNQVATMLSTQKAGIGLRKELLEYKRESFKEAARLAKANSTKGYVFSDGHDPYKVKRFIDILNQHQIEVYQLGKDHKSYKADQSYIVELDPKQYRLTKSIFEDLTSFQDSLFYDVSAWTMPRAYDIPYESLNSTKGLKGAKIGAIKIESGIIGNGNAYAYLVPWNQYLAPRLLKTLHNKGVMVKMATEKFTSIIDNQDIAFDLGTLIIPVGNNQSQTKDELEQMLSDLANYNHLKIYKATTGQVVSGFSLGSRSTEKLNPQNIMMVIGDGINSYDAGEIWHHFDQVLEMPVAMVDAARISRMDLSEYTTIIMPDGNYTGLNNSSNKIKEWVRSGGNLVAFRRANTWLQGKDIISAKLKSTDTKKSTKENYGEGGRQRGALVTGGMIAKTDIDITHPLFYGYERNSTYMFRRGNDFFEPLGNPYATPARYSKNPVVSGYLHKNNEAMLQESAAVLTSSIGRGQIITIMDNPLFRGYWWGGSKLFANAIFLGEIID